MKTKETTKSGKSVTVKTRPVGQAFATDAVVIHRGKVLATTRDYPYGFDAAAHSAALALLETL